jgi:hypothetical protein
VNDPPVAANNSYSTAEERALNVTAPGILGNDTDVDGDILTAVLVAVPSHGTLTLNTNGSFTYTPAAAYNGADSFTYQARDPSGALSNTATVSFTVTPPTITISDVTQPEGNILTTPFTFTVTLSSPTSRTISVNYATADGTANSTVVIGDYAATSGTLVFQGGQVSKTVTVNVNGDVMVEPNETFFVNLSNSTNAPIVDSQGLGTIVNDDNGLLVADGANIVDSSAPTLTDEALAPIATEAMARWAAAGVYTTVLGGIQIQIVDLPDTALGASSTGVIYIDANAAGYGWFVDPTPSDDSEFLIAGDQGEQSRMDLLTVVTHEMGHALGFEHSDTGVMQETLPAGVRHMEAAPDVNPTAAASDSALLAMSGAPAAGGSAVTPTATAAATALVPTSSQTTSPEVNQVAVDTVLSSDDVSTLDSPTEPLGNDVDAFFATLDDSPSDLDVRLSIL